MYRQPILFFFCLGPILMSCQESNKTAKDISDDTAPETNTVAENQLAASLAELPRLPTEFTTDYIMGKFEPSEHPDFTEVDATYADEPGYYLRKDTYQAFQNMHEAARQAGVELQIISATRNFYRQKGIWEAKWTGKRGGTGAKNYKTEFPEPQQRARTILLTSSMPGTSRHHWGTDIDLNDLNNEFFTEGEGLKLYTWLTEHAATYGFCQPYTAKGADRAVGYEEERWHWSYMPVSRALTKMAGERLSNDMIEGFEGVETARQINVVQEYILGVNPLCKN